VAAPPERFRGDRFDVFSGGADSGGTGSGGTDTVRSPAPGSGDPGDGASKTPKVEGTELPEYCLVRLLDVTVEPGKTYEYQLRIRMSNPNQGRRDVASPTYSTAKELHSEWSKVPIKVQVKPDLYYYAVDEKELFEADPKKRRDRYQGPYLNRFISKDREVVLQAHRWFDMVRMNRTGNPLLIGEWAVADRFPVARGEYVGREERVEVPYWRYTREDFVVATDSSTTKRRPGIEAPFGYNAPSTNQPEAILVDFDNGKHGYARVTGKVDDEVKTKAVLDTQAVEVLLLEPDGKLALLEAADDVDDKERIERRKAVRERLDQVRGKGKGKDDKKNPFGGN
jgi:hypothetical protein